MTPFFRFRVWLRGGPPGERAGAALVSLVVLGLLGWALIPVTDDESTGEDPASVHTDDGDLGTADPTGEGAAPVATAPGSAPTATLGSMPAAPRTDASEGGGRATTASGSGDACAGLRATDQGVTPSEIFVAVSVVNLGGEVGNETFGVRGDNYKLAPAVAEGINAEGGVACRKLRVKVYRINPLSPEEQRAGCLQIAGDKPFAVVDIGGYLDPASRSCFIEAKIPYQGTTTVNDAEAADAFPYMYSVLPSTDRAARNWVFEAAARGTFEPSRGFRKLGLLLQECNPKANGELLQNLDRVGVRSEQLSVFTLGGCSSISPPSQVGQAVVQHRRDDVSHVFLAGNTSNSQNYVRQADGVRWKPGYLASDYGFETLPASQKNWPDGFDGAIAITSLRSGERNSGVVHPLVTQCNEWMAKANVRPSQEERDQSPIVACDQLRLFVAAANAAGPDLTRATLLEGLAKVGRFEGGWVSTVLYDRRAKVTGGDFVRAIQWHRDCTCWKLLDRELKQGH